MYVHRPIHSLLYPRNDADHEELYDTIDSIEHADIEWQAFIVTYAGPLPEDSPAPSWMTEEYTVWFRCPRKVLHTQLGNPDFKGEMDFTPKRVYHGEDRVYQDFMSGDWCWDQAVSILFIFLVLSNTCNYSYRMFTLSQVMRVLHSALLF